MNIADLLFALSKFQANVELILGHAKFTGPKEVLVNDVTLTAKHILVATGTKPIIPDVPGKYF